MKLIWCLAILVIAIAANPEAATIHELIDQGDSAGVAALLDANAASLTERLPNGRTPLHTAAYGGKLNIVALLISRGADLNAVNTIGATPMHGAALAGHEPVVKLLLDKGAQPDIATVGGYTPLTNAVNGGFFEMAKLLISSGASVNPKSDSVNSPLIGAIVQCNLEGVEYLLDAGANPNHQPINGESPITTAALTVGWGVQGSERAPQMITALLKHGADPNLALASGFTALMMASREGDTASMRVLFDAGADPGRVAKSGATAFGLAVMSDNLPAVRYLIDKQVSTEQLDTATGCTPLHMAVAQGNLPIVEAILPVVANPSAVCKVGLTPLDIALRYGHARIADVLTKAGAITKVKAKEKLSSAYLAEKPKEGEAYLWYLGNCGYLIRTANHCLVFDYFTNGRRPTEPSLANGYINTAELAKENVTTFVSHEHLDHFDSTIFSWPGTISKLRYVFGFQPESVDARSQASYAGQPYEYVGPGMNKTVDGMQVFAVRSNDAGVGFVLKVDGLTIYHAGDLAGWLPEQKTGFTSQIDSIDALFDSVDIALVNVTGCHHQDTLALAEGTAYTIDKLQPKLVIPTHGGSREYYYKLFMSKFADKYPNLVSFCPEWRGDAAKFTVKKKPAQLQPL